MSKKFISIIMLIAVALGSFTSYALDATITNGVISISDEGYSAEKVIPVVITKPGADIYSMNDTNIKQSIIFAYQAQSGSNGSLQLNVKLPQNSPAGWYTVWTGATSDAFYYATDGEINSAVSEFTNATVATINSAIDTYTVKKPIVYLDLSGLYSEYKSYVQKVFVTQIQSSNPADIGEIQTCYAKAIDIVRFAKDDSVSVLELLNQSKYSDLVDSINSACDVADMFINVRPTQMYTFVEVESTTRIANALVALNKSVRSQAMNTVSVYNDVFCLNLSGDYLKCDPLEVGKALSGHGFTSVSQVQNAFNNRVRELISNSSRPGSTPSVGGSSGPSFSASLGGNDTPSKPQDNVPQIPQTEFVDMIGYEWSQDYVAYLTSKGVVNGTSASTYSPGDNLTREQYVKMIALCLGVNPVQKTKTFEDTDEDAWYAPYIAWAVESGIVNGISETKFGVGESITREDMCVIACRALNYLVINMNAGTLSFKDTQKISDYAAGSVSLLVGENIISGKNGGFFAPKDYSNRAEAAKVIYLIMQKGGAFDD